MNVAAARVLAFVVSAACAGLAGALLAIVTGLVAPGAFTITLSIALLTAAVIGGLGTLPGAVWGSLVIVLVPTYATDVATSHGLSSSVASNIPVAAYGAVLILVMLLFPQGIQGAVRWALGLFGISRPALGLASLQTCHRSNPMKRKALNEEIEPASRARLAVVAAAALAVAACSSGSVHSSPAAPARPRARAAAAAPPRR